MDTAPHGPARLSVGRRAAGLLAAVALAACCGQGDTGTTRLVTLEVRPFEVAGQEEGVDFVGRALAGSLTRHLAAAQGVALLAEGSETRPTRLVTGTLQRDTDGGVRANLRLLDAATGAVLWEAEEMSERGDLSAVASALARRTAEVLGGSFPPLYDQLGSMTGGPAMSDSPLAGRAREAWHANDLAGLEEASSKLAEAFPADPAALVMNAWALMLAWDAEPTSETLVRLKERLDALGEVDPSSPYQELLRAFVYRASGEPGKALVLYARVLGRDDLTPSARAWAFRQRSFTQGQLGNTVMAVDDAERAASLDPASALSLGALSRALESAGRLDEAIESSRQALLLEPLGWRHHQRLGLVLARARRYDEAVAACERACDLGSAQEPCANLAVTLQRAGDDRRARDAAAHADALPGTRWGRYNLACYDALAGDAPAALANLRRALELGFADALVGTDTDLDSLRGEPSFEAIAAEVESRLASRREMSSAVFPWQ